MYFAFVLGLLTASGWASPTLKDPVFKGTYFYNFENSCLTPEGIRASRREAAPPRSRKAV